MHPYSLCLDFGLNGSMFTSLCLNFGLIFGLIGGIPSASTFSINVVNGLVLISWAFNFKNYGDGDNDGDGDGAPSPTLKGSTLFGLGFKNY